MKEKIFNLLNELEINYSNFEHNPVNNAYDDKGVDIPAKRVKSLLLKNRNASRFYMAVIPAEKRFNSKLARHSLGENKLIFVDEEKMFSLIGVKPGYVSPLALINDKDHSIKVIFDSELKGKVIGLHPGVNDNTVVINISDVEKFLTYLGNDFLYLDLDGNES